MKNRPEALRQLQAALEENPICALLGPRQCGKSTLAGILAEKRQAHWFDLERAADAAAPGQPEPLWKNGRSRRFAAFEGDPLLEFPGSDDAKKVTCEPGFCAGGRAQANRTSCRAMSRCRLPEAAFRAGER